MGDKPAITGKVAKIYATDYPIDEIAKQRHLATQQGLVVFVDQLFALTMVSAAFHDFRGHYYGWAAVCGIFSLVLILNALRNLSLAWTNFNNAYRKFFLRRYVAALDRLTVEGYDWTKITDQKALNRWEFWKADDLEQFERALLDYLRSFRRVQSMLRRKAKWAAANARLTERLGVMLDEFGVTGAERQEILNGFSAHDNPSRRKEALAGIRTRLVQKDWEELYVFANSTGPSGFRSFPEELTSTLNEEDFRLRHLEKEASKVVSDSAKQYYQQALDVSTRREKIRLLKRALSEDIRSVRAEVETPVVTAPCEETSANEVRHLSLQDFVRERLVDISMFAEETDWRMCREVVLALARPGQSGGRFNKRYFAEDTVKRMVRRSCDMYGGDLRFKPEVFSDAVSWLLKQGVLVTKSKTDERTLSLSTNTRNATPQGAKLIGMILRLKREVNGLPN